MSFGVGLLKAPPCDLKGGSTVDRSASIRDTARQIVLTATFGAIGLLIPYLAEKLLQLELSKITKPRTGIAAKGHNMNGFRD